MNPKVSIIGTGHWGKILVQKFHHLCGLHLVYGHQNRDVLAPLNLQFTEDIDALIEESKGRRNNKTSHLIGPDYQIQTESVLTVGLPIQREQLG